MTFSAIAKEIIKPEDAGTEREVSTRFHNEHEPPALLKLFRSAVTPATFYEVAEKALHEIEEPLVLVECAELASQREPGGTYYRAKFLYRVQQLLADASGTQLTFSALCKAGQIPIGVANRCIKLGAAITQAEQEVATCLSLLPAPIFEYALYQRGRSAEYLVEASRFLEKKPDATVRQLHNGWCARNGSIKSNLDIIKPSDWWAFSHPKWRKEEDFPGSIPGEVYANALYYFAPERGVIADPMAGSGMLKRVYDDRERWQKERCFDLEVFLFDLYPRRDFIKQHDVKDPLPHKAHWIFLDPPYFGQSKHLYGGDLATMTNYEEYLARIEQIVSAMAASLFFGGRLCIFLPKWSGLSLEYPNYDVPADAAKFAERAGLRWIDAAYVSRARQQEPGSAMKNIAAKRNQRMRSDTCVLNIFERTES